MGARSRLRDWHLQAQTHNNARELKREVCLPGARGRGTPRPRHNMYSIVFIIIIVEKFY